MFQQIKIKWSEFVSDKNFAEIFKGSVWAFGAQIVSTALAMLFNILIARLFGANVLGSVAMIVSFLSLATIFTVLGTNTSILRLIPEHISRYSSSSAFQVYRKVLWLVIGISVVAGTLIFIFSDFIARNFFSKPHLTQLFALSALFLPFAAISDLNLHAIRGIKLIRSFAFMQLLPALAKFSILAVLCLFTLRSSIPFYALFSSYIFTAIIGIFIILKKFHISNANDDIIHPASLKYILTLSLPMFMTSVMSFFIGQVGLLILGMFRSETEVGYYDIAVKLASLTTFILGAVNAMAAPKFSELYSKGKIYELLDLARKTSKMIFGLTFPLLLILSLGGDSILQILFGSDFSVAYIALLLLVMGQFVNSISGSVGYFMNMTGNQTVFRNIIFVGALLNIFFSLILIPKFGINGAAAATTISLIFWNIATLIFIKVKYGKIIGYFTGT